MKKAITISLVLALWGCKTNQIQETTTVTPMKQPAKTMATIGEPIEETREIMLTGKITKSDLQKSPYNTWFNPNEESYIAKDSDLSAIKTQNQNYEIKIFMGTWCGDSKEYVPHFYKILNQTNFDLNKVTLIAVDRSKTTPDHLEKDMNITHVPTFIFYKDGKEVHRIVESPAISLENDMLKIISGEPYKHNYEN
jgi:thiol-disulfide isomerase/thioredoxin